MFLREVFFDAKCASAFIFGVVYRIPYLCNHREYQKISISKVNHEITNNLFSEKERFFIAILNPFFVF